MTLPFELASWFRKMGFRTVINETRVVRESTESNLRRASELHESDHWVCLLVHEYILGTTAQSRQQSSMFPSHWIVLRDKVRLDQEHVSMTVFSWGEGTRQVPFDADEMPIREFLDHYYGFIAAKH